MKRRRRTSHSSLTIEERHALLQVKMRKHIEEHGCSIIGVFGTEDRPNWTYSIGIPTTVPEAAEILIYGLGPDNAGRIINLVVEQLREGRIFDLGRQYRGILKDLPVYFGRVEDRHYDDHVGQAQDYHESSTGFPLWQLVWTDTQGRFPWQEGFEEKFRVAQPLLFDPSVHGQES